VTRLIAAPWGFSSGLSMYTLMLMLMLCICVLCAGCGPDNNHPATSGAPPGTNTPDEATTPDADAAWQVVPLAAPCPPTDEPAIRRSVAPGGRWEVHARTGEPGNICLYDRKTGEHALLFSFLDALTPEERDQYPWQYSVPTWPTVVWAGDGSGVYVRTDMDSGSHLWFVTVPAGDVSSLGGNPVWFNSRDLRTQVLLLTSPQGTRDLVLLESSVSPTAAAPSGNPSPVPDLRHHRLVIRRPDGTEAEVVDEFEGLLLEAEANPKAIMLALGDPGGRTQETPPPDGAGDLLAHSVYLYRRGATGSWDRTGYSGLAYPHLWGSQVTAVFDGAGRPWLFHDSATALQDRPCIRPVEAGGGPQAPAPFALPEEVLRRGALGCCWDTSGEALLFPGADVAVTRRSAP